MKKLLLTILLLCCAWLGFSQGTLISKREYFIDTDPGPGNGIAASFSATDSVRDSFSVAITGTLSPGSHRLYIRYANADGTWGNTVSTLFSVTDTGTTLLTGEYFVDTDPGAGFGTTFTTTAGDSTIGSIALNTSSLSIGSHKLYVRYKGQSGGWGNTVSTLFSVTDTAVTLLTGEYFVDTDPGAGNGTAFSSSAGDSAAGSIAINTAGMSVGSHNLYVRYKGQTGGWGNTAKTTMNVTDSTFHEINTGEYFIDTDPGVGNATAISVTPGDSVTAGIAISAIPLADGVHTVYFRYRNNVGQWGGSSQLTFTICGGIGPVTGAMSVCAGYSTTLSDTTAGGTWSSSNTSVATAGTSGVVTGVSGGTVVITYTTSGCHAVAVVTVNAVPAISGLANVCPGVSATLSDVLTGGAWTSSSSAHATIGSATGIVTGVAAGTALISYTVGTCRTTFEETVITAPLAITPSGAVSICSGSSFTLSDATGGGAWTSSNTSVASAGSGSGIVNGIAVGTAVISYALGTSCAAVKTISVITSPTAISGVTSLCTGNTTTLSDGVGGGTWSSSNIAVGTVNSSGIFSGISVGSVIITYSLGNGCFAYKTETVNLTAFAGTISGPASVCAGASVTLSDASATGLWSSSNTTVAAVGSSGIVSGFSAGTTVVSYSVTTSCGTASAIYVVTVNPLPTSISGIEALCAGSTTTLSDSSLSGTWSSGNTVVGTIDASGMVTGLSAGTAEIYYTVSGCSAATIVTVNPLPVAGSISGASNVCAGASITLTESGSGTWSSSNPTLATVSSAGTVSGVAAGTVAITYTVTNGCGAAIATYTVTINPIPASISGTAFLCAGTTTTLTDATPSGVWSSGNTAIATIALTGVVSGVTAGNAVIDYTVSGCSAFRTITVNALPVAGTISGSSFLCAGATTVLSETLGGGAWTSANNGIATVSGGLLTGVAAGTTVISYTVTNICGAAYAPWEITVNPLPAAIVVDSAVCAGATITASDSTTGGTWNTHSVHASIDSTGRITGTTSGTEIITYLLPTGCMANQSVAVDTLPGSVFGDSAICVGATGYVYDSIAGGSWQSSNTAIAALTDSGGFSYNYVYGVAAGVALITYELRNACGDNVAIRSFTINPLPTDILMPEAICITYGATAYDATPGGTWSSQNGNVNIDGSGFVTGLHPGPFGYDHTLPYDSYTDYIRYTLPTGCYVQEGIWLDRPTQPLTGPSSVYVGSIITLGDTLIDGNWNSANTALATVSGYLAGLAEYGDVTGIAPGTAIISYTDSNSCGVHTVTKEITVVCPSAITLGLISGPSTVCARSSIVLYNAVSGGNWTSSDTALATCGGYGSVYGVSPGTVTITYTVSNSCGVTSSITYNITVTPTPVVSVTDLVCVSASVTATADISGGTWSCGNSSITVDEYGNVTGVTNATYSTVINTLSDGCSGSASLYVGLPVPGALGVDTALCRGAETGIVEVTGFTCSTYPYSTYWNNSNDSVAALIANPCDCPCPQFYNVYGVSAGTAIITYTDSNSCGVNHVTKNITVVPAPFPIGLSQLVCVGATTTATVTPSGGEWSNTDGNVTIGSSGIVTGINNATYASVNYTLPDGCYTTTSIYVGLPEPLPISGDTSVCVGGTRGISEGISNTGYFDYAWKSSNSAIATIGYTDYYGFIDWYYYGVSTGTDTIIYTDSNACGSNNITLTVHIVPSASLAPVILSQDTICVGGTILASDSTSGGTWSVSGSALINSSGEITDITNSLLVYYTVNLTDGCFATATAAIITQFAPGPIEGDSTVRIGQHLSLSDIVSGGRWTSSNPFIATVDSLSGTVTGVSSGSDTITYTLTNTCGTGFVVKPIKVSYYCAPSFVVADSSCGPYGTNISEFIVRGVSGTSINDHTSCNGTTNFEDLSDSMSVTLNLGQTYSVQIGNAAPGGIGESGQVWIDFNNNGVFESSESVGGIYQFYNTSDSFNITIPPGAPSGTHFMRVVANYPWCCNGQLYPDIDPCATNVFYGDARDYKVIIQNGNHQPRFINGGDQTLVVCENGIDLPIDSLLAVSDSNVDHTISWSTVANPVHGTLTASYSTLSTGLTLFPAGLSYTPATNYTGTDSFIISVSDTGLTATTKITVIINPLPVAGTISGAAGVCAGATITLSDSSGGGSWTSSNSNATVAGGVVSGVDAGMVIISYAVSNSCGNAVATRVVTINPAPVAGTISGVTSVCAGSTITLSDSSVGGSWTSSNSNATVTGGVVSGVDAGTVTISYAVSNTCGNAVATQVVTINPAPVAGIISGAASVCVGATITLSDSSGGGSWTSSNSNATVTGGVVTGVAAGTCVVSYTFSNLCGTTVAVQTITVSPMPVAGYISGVYSLVEGNSITLTGSVIGGYWSSSNPAVATIGSITGIVSGVAVGTVIISYLVTNTCGSAFVSKTLTVFSSGAGLITGILNICTGSTALLIDSTTGGTWTSRNTSVATIGSSSGIVTGITAGTTIITYTVSGNYTTATVTVNTAPGSISGTASICKGASATLFDVTGGTWSSSAAGIASIGTSGAYYGVSAGTAVVSYTFASGCGVTKTVTINPTPSAIFAPSIQCTGQNTQCADSLTGGVWMSSNTSAATIGTNGISTGVNAGVTIITYSISGCYTIKSTTVYASPYMVTGPGSICTGVSSTFTDASTGGVWSTSNMAVASIGTSGIVSGVASGTSVISYSLASGCASTKAITVSNSPFAISGPGEICTGSPFAYSDFSSGGIWTSSNSSVVNVGSLSGIATGVASSIANIIYSVSGCNSIKTVTVNTSPAPISGITGICTGSSATFADVTSGGVWTSSNNSVAVVGSSSGLITGLTPGTSIISYTISSGCNSLKNIIVNSVPFGISGPVKLCSGQTSQFTDASPGGSWVSSNTSAAIINPSGIATGVTPAPVTISYTFSGCSATLSATVNATPYAVTGASLLCTGISSSYTDVTAGGSWTSTNTSVATFTGTLLSGVSAGTSIVSYTVSSGCANTKVIVVNTTPEPVTGASNICTGVSYDFSDSSTGGVWTSSNTSASIVGSSTGIVTGVAAPSIAVISYSISGCSALETVSVNPSPYAISGTETLNIGSPSTFTDALTGGRWTSGNSSIATVGSSTGIVTGVALGTTLISYTVNTGCGVNKIVNIIPAMGRDNNSEGIIYAPSSDLVSLSISPNPNKGIFVISGYLGTTEGEVSINITDILGLIIFDKNIIYNSGKLNETIELGNQLANGMYLLYIHSEKVSQVFHVILNR